MNESRFTESHIVAILKEGNAGRSVKYVCRANGIRSATFYDLKYKYRGIEGSELQGTKELEEERALLTEPWLGFAKRRAW